MERPGASHASRRPARAAAALIVTAAALGAAIILAVYEPTREPELVVRSPSGFVLARLPISDGLFSHVFLHSFHLTPVEERFRIEAKGLFGARIRLYELRYQSLGVGMPEDAEGGYRLEDGFFVLKMDRSFDSIPVLVSILPGHGIIADGAYLPFRNWAAPEGALRLSARMAIIFRPRR
jgi:hypothetical protein